MKQIPLTKGKVAIVDDSDFDALSKWKWCAASGGRYAARANYHKETQTSGVIFMHRVIMNAPSDMQVDHIDGNGLDNRRENLRLATHAENQHNRGKTKRNVTGFKGVFPAGKGSWHS